MKHFLLLLFCFGPIIWLRAQEHPNIILFIADDISFDDFGCYGNSVVKTPHIDGLAENGLRFNNMYLTASSCSPSRNSIITGRYPHNTGAPELHTEPPLSMVSFPEILRQKGYYTALSGKFHMGAYAKKGFDDLIIDAESIGDGGEEAWVDILRNRPNDKPFFLWYAAYDAHRNWGENKFQGTHDPNRIHPPEYLTQGTRTKQDLASYYDEIARFDYYIGEVVNELQNQKVLENTILIVMSDNGRPFPHSKTRINDRGLKTPFVVHWPMFIEGSQEFNGLVSAIDIAPTILELTKEDVPDFFQGHSFKNILTNSQDHFRNYVFGEHNWHDYEAHGRMVRDGSFMYILNSRPKLALMGPADSVSSPSQADLDSLNSLDALTDKQKEIFLLPRPKEELYDLAKDPNQYMNLASKPENTEVLLKYRAILQEWMTLTGDNIPKSLTKDWYKKTPGYIKTSEHGIRGEMPGYKTNATKNNNKGPF